MLSLPPISQSFIWDASPFRLSRFDPPPATQTTHQHSPHARPNPPTRPARSALSTLLAEEAAFAASKERARKFGAGWLRPPGVSKTLQGMEDERLEREEQQAVSDREQALLNEQAAAEQAEAAQALLQGDGAVEMGEGEATGERDLDAEIPEAEGDGWVDVEEEEAEEEEEEDDDEEDEEGEDGEESIEERMDVEVEQGEESVQQEGLARDLDDDVPEAGSYQHTDTDVEDESSEVEESPALGWSAAGAAPRAGGPQLESSLFGSSPVAQRRERDGGGGRNSGRRAHGN